MDISKKNLYGENWIPGPFTKEAFYYEKREGSVKCLLCPNACIIRDGQLSSCNTRVCKDGKLYSIAFGNPCSAHIDPIEKKPLYHFFPGSEILSIATAGCNLHCLNCQNWTISQVSPDQTENLNLMPEEVVKLAIKHNCSSIAYTYTEPVVFYEYVYETAKLARSAGIKNVLISNGYINSTPLRDLCKFIDAANINLKGFNDETYIKLNSGRLATIQETLLTMKSMGVWLEITNLIIPGWTDDISLVSEMCKWLFKNDLHEYPLHFSRFSPGYKLENVPVTPIAILESAYRIAKEEGIKYAYLGNVHGHFSENTLCHNCGKTLVSRDGFKVGKISIIGGKCKFCGEKIPGCW